ncbi:hypothetical protein EJ08DRAFT_313298 [Tothia fuscella]|uniref:Uncharacterized protein n=1 Tax=Tothia fuscella TaxID=1048955 RepID=A0A9P4NN41_9PEZI|nr:hypothetical protein EJ08DRAFT_313298 [Tothia fuscella]
MELGEIDEVASRRQEDRMAAIERQLTKAINAQAELSRENTALKEDNKALRKSHDALKKLVEHCVREGLIASKANACLDNISSEMVSSPDHRPKDSRSDSAFPSGGSVKNGSALEDTDASTVQKLTTSQEKLTKNILAMEKAAADFKKSAENRLLTFQEQTERDIRGIKKAINHIIDGVDSTRRATAHAWLKDGMILKNVREEVASLWGQVSRLEVMTVVPDKAQVNNQRDRIAVSSFNCVVVDINTSFSFKLHVMLTIFPS